MILAEKKRVLQRQWESVPHEQKQNKSERAINKKFRYFLVVLTMFLIGIIILIRYANIVEANYRLEASKKRLAEIKNETALLKVKLAELRSYDRIEEIAINKLGMQKPTKEQFVFIEEKEHSPMIMNYKHSP
ncbi:MAG: hypothetical protein PWQ82_652 [Thermosediminibacterales bacterium]|nr:hypothetical protein [Thermosediminibacterales bacterium]MDK2835875.1 hypothetical protein [Thermosediminibacterales bacterium]